MYNIKKLNNISKIVYDHLPKESYMVSSHIEEGDVDAYLLRSADCHEMELDDRVLAFARAGAGVNNIPIDRCTEKGIVVFNTPGANANAVKELVFAAMLVASRNIIPAANWAQSLKGQQDESKLVEKGKKQFVGPELMGKTLGVIGLGNIGSRVANTAIEFGMDVIGFDPFISVKTAWNMHRSVKMAETLEDVIENSDYITMHIPYTEKTKNYLNGAEFAKMKPGVTVMNFSRGELVRIESLLDSIERGTVRTYVTDFIDDRLLGNPNVIVIPHLGASTPESEENCAAMAAEELREFIEYGSIQNSVNMPACIMGENAFGSRVSIIHKNLPNMVGQISAAIARDNGNIGDMVNKSRGDIAYTVISTDDPISHNCICDITRIEGVIKLRVL